MQARAWIARLGADLLVFFGPPALFLLAYVRYFAAPSEAILAHLRVVVILVLSLIVVRFLIARFLRPPAARDIGARIKVASWAPVAEGASGEPAWDVVARHLREEKVLRPSRLNRPRLIGVRGNPGIAQISARTSDAQLDRKNPFRRNWYASTVVAPLPVQCRSATPARKFSRSRIGA